MIKPKFFIIGLTLLIGLVLMILPLPLWLEHYRPEWLFLILIYWAIYCPERVGIGIAWCSGLLLDVLQGTLLGEYALLAALMVFIVSQTQQRLQLFHFLQQCIFIFLLLGIQFILVVWIQGLSGHPLQNWEYALPVLTSTLIWPFVAGSLQWIQKR